MKKFMKLSGFLALAMALATPVFTACDNDDYDTQQYKGGVNLNSFDPAQWRAEASCASSAAVCTR